MCYAHCMSWAPGKTLEQVKKEAVIACLEHFKGNRTHTATSLGVSLRSIRNWINDYLADGDAIIMPICHNTGITEQNPIKAPTLPKFEYHTGILDTKKEDPASLPNPLRGSSDFSEN